MPQLVLAIVTVALTAIAIAVALRQCRKPAWLPGRFFLWIMNRSHRGLTAWGLGHLEIAKNFTILDVGCGGGRTIHTLASMASEGTIYGIDYSGASVAVSRRTNAEAIRTGRVNIQQASVSHLPFPDGKFDAITAIETMYYWPDPVADLREALRALKPGGRVLILAETYRGRRGDAMYRPAMGLLRTTYLSPEEHKELLEAAGYSNVAVDEERKKSWLCVVGQKPAG